MLYKKVPYDPVRDFAPITLAATAPQRAGGASGAAGAIARRIHRPARKQAGALSYGTPGIGTSPHLCMELLKSMAGIDLAARTLPRHRGRR